MENLQRFIKELAFFDGMKPDYLELLTGCAANTFFKKGTIIGREGDEADNFFVIRSGKISIEIEYPGYGTVVIQTLDEGDVFGWSWLFPPHKRRFNSRAKEDTRALIFDGVCLRGKCEENCELGFDLMKRFARVVTERLESTRLQLLEMMEKPSDFVSK